MFQKFRPRADTLEAIYFSGSEADAATIAHATGGAVYLDQFNPDPDTPRLRIFVPTYGYPSTVMPGMWVIKVESRHDPTYHAMAATLFAKTYESVIRQRMAADIDTMRSEDT